jgi:hypothetical protein
MCWDTRPAGLCRVCREVTYINLGYFSRLMGTKSVFFAIMMAPPYRAALERE